LPQMLPWYNQEMEPTRSAIEQLWREEIEEARRMPLRRKLELGGELFDSACEVALAAIKAENPGITQAAALDLLRQRLELSRKLEMRL
jgi:hypothetical protein